MPAGMRVWDKSTNIQTIDTSTSVFVPFGVLVVGGDGAPQSGSITDSNFLLGTPAYMILQVGIGQNTTYKFIGQSPVVTIQGTTLSWDFGTNGAPNFPIVRIIYGLK